MGLALTSALIGVGLTIIGFILLVMRKPGTIASLFLVAGIALIVVPYGLIYLLLD